MNTVDPQPLYGWNTLDWRKIERRVFKLQTRITEPSVVARVKPSASSRDS